MNLNCEVFNILLCCYGLLLISYCSASIFNANKVFTIQKSRNKLYTNDMFSQGFTILRKFKMCF